MDKFVAIADPTRRKIIELLAKAGQLSATRISDEFPVSPQAISQHLKILREANLVQVEKRAQQRIYRLNSESMQELEEWTRQLRKLWSQRFDAFDQVVQEEKNRFEGEAK